MAFANGNGLTTVSKNVFFFYFPFVWASYFFVIVALLLLLHSSVYDVYVSVRKKKIFVFLLSNQI